MIAIAIMPNKIGETPSKWQKENPEIIHKGRNTSRAGNPEKKEIDGRDEQQTNYREGRGKCHSGRETTKLAKSMILTVIFAYNTFK